MNDAQQLSNELSQLNAFRVWFAALPGWSQAHRRSLQLTLSMEEEGVGVQLSFPSAPEEEAALYEDLLDRLGSTERLQQLALLVDQLRQMGIEPDRIEPLVEEANALARQLHPDGQALDDDQVDALMAHLRGDT